MVAGDSTIGKSAFVQQQAICIATGTPFLGMPTTQGRVVHFDLENTPEDNISIHANLTRFLGVPPETPDLLTAHESPVFLERLLELAKPVLVIFDALRSYKPLVLEKNTQMGVWLKEIRGLAHKHTCAFQFVHHLRKPARDVPSPLLNDVPTASWLLEMEGPRALVNQTDVRVAVSNRDANDPESAAIKVKWNRRVHGDSPLYLLERVLDDEDPIGYRPVRGADMLSKPRQEALSKLPSEFTFKDAEAALGRAADPTNKMLIEAQQLGVITKVRKGLYRKAA